MNEIFKNVVGYEGLYEVSNYGTVKSVDRKIKWKSRSGVINDVFVKGKVLSPSKTKNGYLNVVLCKDTNKKHHLVHRLVAECFCCNVNEFNIVNHIDCNKTNNYYKNLEWCTTLQNNTHSKENMLYQRYEDRKFSKLTKEKVLKIPYYIQEGATTDDLSKLFEVSRRCIDNIFEGKNWTGLGIDFTELKPNRKYIGIPSKFNMHEHING